MALRSVLDIEVNSEAFDKFYANFQKFQAEAGKTTTVGAGAGAGGAGAGRGGSHELGAAGLGALLEKILNDHAARSGARGPGHGPPAGPGGVRPGGGSGGGNVRPGTSTQDASNAERISRAHERSSAASERMSKAWGSIKDATLSVARNVGNFVRDLLKVTGMLGMVGGLATGFGFFGMDALGRLASGFRRQSMGLGTSVGGMRAFETNFQRFADPQAMLSGVSQAMRDPSKAAALLGLGIHTRGTEDTADVAALALQKAQELAKSTPEHLMGATFQARQLSQLGLSFEDFMRLRQMLTQEMREQQGAFGRDRRTFNLPDDVLRRWQDFTTVLTRSKNTIETTFIEGLGRLTAPLGRLSTAFTHLLEVVLKKLLDSGALDKLAGGLNWLADQISKPEFEQKVKDFIDGIGDMAVAIYNFLKGAKEWIPGMGAGGTKFLPGVKGDPNEEDPNDPWQDLTPNLEGPNEPRWQRRRGSEGHPGLRWFVPAGSGGSAGGAGSLSVASLAGRAAAPNPNTSGINAFFQRLEAQRGLPAGTLDALWMREANRSFNPPTSAAGAVGPFQFMAGTAARFHLADRTDFNASAGAAAEYVQANLGKFNGDIAKALAGYNWGEDNVEKAVAQYGDRWLEHAPKETQDYLAAILPRLGGVPGAPGATAAPGAGGQRFPARRPGGAQPPSALPIPAVPRAPRPAPVPPRPPAPDAPHYRPDPGERTAALRGLIEGWRAGERRGPGPLGWSGQAYAMRDRANVTVTVRNEAGGNATVAHGQLAA